jgi:hypothetical protein
MDTFFREKVKADVDYLNPFVNVAISENLDPDGVANEIQYLGEPVGLALRRALTCPMEINLMPPGLVAKKRMRKRQPFFALAIAGVVLIMLCWWMYYQRIRDMMDGQTRMVEQKKGTLERDQGLLRAAQKEKAEAQKRVETLLGAIGRRTEWIEIIDEIHTCMLDGMWLKSLQPVVRENQITQIEIQGMGFDDKLKAADRPDATAVEVFRDALRKRPPFTAETEIKTVSPLLVSSAREFTLRIALRKPIPLR